MHFGPILAPSHVPALQKEFAPYLFLVIVLTGCLLTLWGLVGIWNASRSVIRKTTIALTSSSLSEAERAMLFVLAKDPTHPLNLDNIDYARAPGSKLELHQLAKGLEGKGLVNINFWDNTLITLTESGRARALEIQRQTKSAGAA